MALRNLFSWGSNKSVSTSLVFEEKEFAQEMPGEDSEFTIIYDNKQKIVAEEKITTQSKFNETNENDFFLSLYHQDQPSSIPSGLPGYLPKRAKNLSALVLPDLLNEAKAGQHSFHKINIAFKSKEKNNKNKKKYHFKHNPYLYSVEQKNLDNMVPLHLSESPMTELEVVCAEWFKLVLGPDFVPKASAYYAYNPTNKYYQLAGLTSKDLTGFKPNQEDPLKESDFDIKLAETEIDNQYNALKNFLNRLLEKYNKKLNDNSYLKNQINYYCGGEVTAAGLQDKVKNFILLGDNFLADQLQKLEDLINRRIDHIKNIKNQFQQEDQEELALLDNIKQSILGLKVLKLTEKVDVKRLEEIDKFVKANESLFLMKNDNDYIKGEVSGTSFTIKEKNLTNYRTISGIAKGLVASYVCCEGDAHNRNLAKNGKRIDFDMSEWGFVFRFKLKEGSLFERNMYWLLNRKPTSHTFQYSVRDIINFPNLKDASFYYWPTQKTLLSPSLIKSTSSLFGKNAYTEEDNKVFLQLSDQPVFVFHKYKTMLKYILTNEDMYRSLAELNLRADRTFVDADGVEKNILNEFVRYKAQNLKDFRDTLLNTLEFGTFLQQHGNYVLDEIKQEFTDYRKEYQFKMDKKNKNHYEKLIKSIDLDKIDQDYQDIYNSMLKTRSKSGVSIKARV